ncbi:hypothetical protein OIDMADRAFT_101886 [Oidiodendron maius Zn]|uniref:Uncharacterized protein n=1 Tax=Oidiodendron maius (strain Zn) TaxID=913774 RepID=A0A0C3D1F3_OIDMZ|nr:hypothetical protein OIDMADRAFT_101886 [Oidiodendron maius Zn]
MDARVTLRAQGDENAVPPSTQLLHQRHKSTGTLSTMMAVGGLKAAAKRTAFGDVSNTTKDLASTLDISTGPGKPLPQPFVRPVSAQENVAAFLRPAQRPLNASQKTQMASTTLEPISKPVSQALLVQPSNRTTKSSTAIYKDSSTIDLSSQPASRNYLPALTGSAHLSLVPRHYKSQPYLKPDQTALPFAQGKPVNPIAIEAIATVISSDPVYEDAPEQPLAQSPKDSYESYMKLMEDKENDVVHEVAKVAQVSIEELHQLPAHPQPSEPEEYWEEEEDEEIYDEQGYTTAHSYRSRGDNTTGGATTILLPKITNKVKKELAEAKELVESARTPEEIDDEAWDTSMVAEYGDEIFAYMRELEIKMLPNAHYMDNQAEIQWSMRSVLMDWLIQVHHRFSLLPETLFLCVNYIDRFLSSKIVSLGKLQLVGATAIFVAAKYEEINCPSVGEIVYMVDGGYTVDEILKAERFMLNMLQFELGWPGPMSFLRRISKADDYDLETRTLAKYFLEVTIMDERFVGIPPSYIAAGAHCLSRIMLKKGDWSPAHVYYSGYTWTQLRPLVSMILECCQSPQKHHGAVYEKYTDRRYKRASSFVQTEMSKGFTLPPLKASRPSLPSPEQVLAQLPYDSRESFKRMVQVQVKG